MTPLPRCHERSARDFAALLTKTGNRKPHTVAAIERGFRWWWGLCEGEQVRTVKAISKRVVELLAVIEEEAK